ncbi:ABC transporter permease [Liquorilactobacillus capillatus]|uniref:Uncharacterized protein n=1 Tax=Liquorilactobacillus capillatus DSM 19910 TaxID=1423731 RepID=A0A0R1M889_9LACO|nr:ABC transporter permease [Liquorilactobacillus capillatus]KRL00507.1 hypothetical protein FC81_GL002038 [Liquorilactobacillus capillatus DSM 19910]
MNLAVKSELLKLKRLHLPLIIIAINALAFVIGSLLYFQNQKVFAAYHTQWFALWSETGLFSSQVFLPILLAIVTAIAIHSEKERNNFARMASLPVMAKQFIIAKFLMLAVLSALSLGIYVVFFYLVALSGHLPSTHNLFIFVAWAILGWMGTLPILAIQLWLSIQRKNFTTPIIIALILSLMSFALLAVEPFLLKLYPFAQIMIGLHARSYVGLNPLEFLLFFGVVLLFTILGLILSIHSLRKLGFE